MYVQLPIGQFELSLWGFKRFMLQRRYGTVKNIHWVSQAPVMLTNWALEWQCFHYSVVYVNRAVG